MPNPKLTLAHVTHEAVEQIGGIGTVLEGLMISPAYQKRVGRSILVGPTQVDPAADPRQRLGASGEVLYSSVDKIDTVDLGVKLRPIEWAFSTPIVYGRRRFNNHGEQRSGEAEVLLIDVHNITAPRLAVFKHRLWEHYGLDSSPYEQHWDYEEYTRLAEPAFYALLALLGDDTQPCILFSHEFMGMPTVLQAMLEAPGRFRSIFHAHECATARRLVEDHPGHDTMFYNVLRQAREKGQFVEDVFGSMKHFFRHELVSRAHRCDAVIAVGDYTRDELKFLSADFNKKDVDLVYNGVPAMAVDLPAKLRSRNMLLGYAKALVGYEPDVLMTHVTRPVISKGLWRDLKVCHEIEPFLTAKGKTAVLFMLTTGGGVRSREQVRRMEKQYGWPREHREGHPDLVGPEVNIYRDVDAFNKGHQRIQVVLVNQFGWERDRIGERLPAEMTIADLRRATDVEFGMATYEPFGISPLEPLGSGAVCVISNVCGCKGFVDHVTKGRHTPCVLEADFTQLDRPRTIDQLKRMTRPERDRIEQAVAAEVAARLWRAVPKTDNQRQRLITSGQTLVARMGWDQVIENKLWPVLQRVAAIRR